MNEYKLIDYMRKQGITLIEENEEVSMDGVIERFKEELEFQEENEDLFPKEFKIENDFIIQIHRIHFNQYELFIFSYDGKKELGNLIIDCESEDRCLINGCQEIIACGFCGGCEEHHIIKLESGNCNVQKEMEKEGKE